MADQVDYQQLLAMIRSMQPGARIKLTFSTPMSEVEWTLYFRNLIVDCGTYLEGEYIPGGSEAVLRKAR